MGTFQMSTLVHPQVNYHRLANRFKPTDGMTLALEVLRLNGNGLTPSDIASALRVPLAWTIEIVSRGAP
jgi:hypothetical protein